MKRKFLQAAFCREFYLRFTVFCHCSFQIFGRKSASRKYYTCVLGLLYPVTRQKFSKIAFSTVGLVSISSDSRTTARVHSEFRSCVILFVFTARGYKLCSSQVCSILLHGESLERLRFEVLSYCFSRIFGVRISFCYFDFLYFFDLILYFLPMVAPQLE